MSAMISPSPSLQGATGSAVGRTNSGNMRDIIPKGYRLGQLGRFTPEQQELFGQLFSNVGPQSYLSQLSKGEGQQFQDMDEQSWRDYQGALGDLNEGFTGMGGKNSSGYQLSRTQAAQDFAKALRMQRHDLQTNALKQLFEMSNMLLSQQPQEKFLTEKRQKPPSWLGQAGLSLLGGASNFGSIFGANKLFGNKSLNKTGG